MKLTFLLSLFLILNVTAQESPSVLTQARPESAGMSSVKLDRIGNMIQNSIDEGNIPGAVALIARDGKIVYYKAFGDANAEGEDLEKDDIFRIASQTKAITATAVMLLWEEGKFQLDDPISKYIPEFKDPQLLVSFKDADSSFATVSAGSEITIRQLLTHTSGIGYGMIDGDERFKKIYAKAGIIDAFTTQNVSLEENIKKLAKLPLHHKPGEKFTYSEGLDVLGYFVEIVSGKPFDEFLNDRIFEPLEMDDTYFYLPESKKDRLVKVQQKKGDDWENFSATPYYDPQYPVTGAKTFFSGGAGLSSTAIDYAKFLQMYLNEGNYNGNSLLSPLTAKMILSNHTEDLFGGPENFYGLAFGVVTKKGEEKGGIGSEGTFDWGGYFNTQYFADPVTDVIGILLKQTQGTVNDETGWKFRQMVFASLIE